MDLAALLQSLPTASNAIPAPPLPLPSYPDQAQVAAQRTPQQAPAGVPLSSMPAPPGAAQMLLKASIPAALALLAGLKGGPGGAAGFLQGVQQGQDRQEDRQYRQEALATQQEARERQLQVSEGRLALSQQQAEQQAVAARRKERERFFELQRSLATPAVLAKLPRESQQRIIDSLAEAAGQLGEDPDAIRQMFAPLVMSATEERRQAALEAEKGFTAYVKANRDKLDDPTFLQASFPTALGPMSVRELLELLPQAAPGEGAPQLRLVTETTVNPDGSESSVQRVVDIGKVPLNSIIGRSRRAPREKEPKPPAWRVSPGEDTVPGTEDDYLYDPNTGQAKPIPGLPKPVTSHTPPAAVSPATQAAIDRIRRGGR